MKKLSAVVRATVWVIFPILAFAQSGPQQARPDPMDTHVSVPPLRYESALDAYRPLDEKTAPAKEWRSANDLVRDTGSMSGMSMGNESGDMKDMDHGAMKNMKGMDKGEMDMKKPKPEKTKPAQQKTQPKQDSMPGMDMSSGDHAKHGKEAP